MQDEAMRPREISIVSKLFWLLLADCLLLGWIGQNVVESPFIEIGQFCTFFYFLYFLVLLPASNISEAYLAPYLNKKFK